MKEPEFTLSSFVIRHSDFVIYPSPYLAMHHSACAASREADFLAFFVAAVAVADRQFENPVAQPRDLGGDLRLEAEAVLLDLDLLSTSRRNTL